MRTEDWRRDEDGVSMTAVVDVQNNGTVVVPYEVFAAMLSHMGFTKVEVSDGS